MYETCGECLKEEYDKREKRGRWGEKHNETVSIKMKLILFLAKKSINCACIVEKVFTCKQFPGENELKMYSTSMLSLAVTAWCMLYKNYFTDISHFAFALFLQ